MFVINISKANFFDSKSCAIDLRTKFFSFSHCGKKIQKLSVKLAQSGLKLVPSVNLRVYLNAIDQDRMQS